MAERRPVALITGASAGLGAAFALVFARHGHDLMLVARREDRLAQLADDIAARGHRRPCYLSVDLQRHDAVDQIAAAMAAFGVEPEVIVNNAGFGLLGPAAKMSRAEQLAMIDVNVRALTDLSLAFFECLERRRGGILNVASVASFLAGPNMAVYYATKAHVLSFSEALHRELRPHNIRVTVLCPGPVPTEFQKRAGFETGASLGIISQSADAVAEAGYRGLRRGKRVVIPGMANRLMVSIMRFLPRNTLMASVGRYNSRRIRDRR
jgi:short-subunit dehydrogenase